MKIRPGRFVIEEVEDDQDHETMQLRCEDDDVVLHWWYANTAQDAAELLLLCYNYGSDNDAS